MNSGHDRKVAMEEAIIDEEATEIRLLRIHEAYTGEKLEIVPGTNIIDDRWPVRGRRK